MDPGILWQRATGLPSLACSMRGGRPAAAPARLRLMVLFAEVLRLRLELPLEQVALRSLDLGNVNYSPYVRCIPVPYIRVYIYPLAEQ